MGGQQKGKRRLSGGIAWIMKQVRAACQSTTTGRRATKQSEKRKDKGAEEAAAHQMVIDESPLTRLLVKAGSLLCPALTFNTNADRSRRQWKAENDQAIQNASSPEDFPS